MMNLAIGDCTSPIARPTQLRPPVRTCALSFWSSLLLQAANKAVTETEKTESSYSTAQRKQHFYKSNKNTPTSILCRVVKELQSPIHFPLDLKHCNLSGAVVCGPTELSEC